MSEFRQNNDRNCCYQCHERNAFCHGSCAKYAEYHKKREEVCRKRCTENLVYKHESDHYRDGWMFRRTHS